MELLGAFLTGVVGPILYFLISRHLDKQREKKRDKIKEVVADTCVVNDELQEIMEEFKGHRVWISQFHNGGNFYPTGKSIQKFSIFFEVTQKGIFIPDFKDPKVATYGLKGAADSVGTKSSYLIPLFTLDDKFIGTIGIDYVTKKKRLTKDEWEHFQIKAGRIAGYLSTHLQKS